MYYFNFILLIPYFFLVKIIRIQLYCYSIVVFSLLVILTTGCGSKSFKSLGGHASDAYVAEKEESVFLPKDDGKPLTKDELKALNSQGLIDKKISQHDLHDIILHFKKYVRYERITIEKNIERASKYLAYIFEELRKENLPEELAYVAFIESGYNPRALSYAGASGLWQFTASTGKYFGMSKNYWVDKRCDPYISTRAAVEYFKMLYKRFNDWHLVITAYNAGEGKVARALAATNTKTFFELRKRNHLLKKGDRLLGEQKQYLPKFIAICKIIRNLELLGFSPFDSSKMHNVVEVKVKPRVNLKAFACYFGVSWEDFFAHNAAYLKHTTPPGIHSVVYIPHHKPCEIYTKLKSKKSSKYLSQDKNKNLKNLHSGKKTVHFSNLKTKKYINRLDNKENFSKKDEQQNTQSLITIAHDQLTTKNSNPEQIHHIVERGDTLYSIAKRYGMNQDLIAIENGLVGAGINIGQKLKISNKETSKELEKENLCTSKTNGKVREVIKYQVQQGDSLWSIARKFNISPFELLVLNNLSKDDIIQPGDYVEVHRN